VDVDRLKERARWVRHQVLEMIASAGKGHLGGSLSCTDILVSLYHGAVLRYDVHNPRWEGRDRLIYSKGHSSETLYAVLADVGFFPVEELSTYGQPGTRLGGHVDNTIPGVEVSTGSLGHGLGIGAGLALSAKLDVRDYLTFVILGDGECYEGSVWEAAMFAAHHHLNNLIAIVDRNGQVTLDYTEDCNRLEPFADKWKAFGWDVHEVDGHALDDLLGTLQGLRRRESPTPAVIIANTKKGKGVSFMEGNLNWHHNVPRGEQLEQARRELALDAREGSI
jgi:transketolase